MVDASEMLMKLRIRGWTFFTGTPCSYLSPLINAAIDDDDVNFIGATNEGDAVAIAAGVSVAGGKALVMFQNSGLGNAVNPLTSLAYTFRIPLLLVVSHRGDPAGERDEPQHELMGRITDELLRSMSIDAFPFPRTAERLDPILNAADESLRLRCLPTALILRKGDIGPRELRRAEPLVTMIPSSRKTYAVGYPANQLPSRRDALLAIRKEVVGKSAVIGTTGYTSRELYDLGDTDNQFYVVGSMGCALPFALGVALQRPNVRVVVIDGDGALFMRTGSMATVGALRPPNLVHITLDNESHESTGGQRTDSASVSFPALAEAFGYNSAHSTGDLNEFRSSVRKALQTDGPTYIHMKIRRANAQHLPRPIVTPVEVKERFAHFLGHAG